MAKVSGTAELSVSQQVAVGRFLFHGDKTVKQSARIENNGV